MRRRRRVARFLIWSLVVIVLISAGLAWFAYALVTDSEMAAGLIKAQAARFLPRSIVETGKVNVGLLRGEVTISQIFVRQRIDGLPFLAARVPWMSVRLDARQVLHGRVEPREVAIFHPTLRLCRRKDGTWNLQGLVADPWPAHAIKNPPPIVITSGTVELIGKEEQDGQVSDRAVAILRDVSLHIEAAAGGRLKFEGSARGDLFEKLSLEGMVDPVTGETTLAGDLAGLTVSENLHRRLPPELRPHFEALALSRGEVGLRLRRLAIHPSAPAGRRIEYDVRATLDGGVWECPKLPFKISELAAELTLSDGLVTIKHAVGTNGNTILRAKGSVALGEHATTPFDLQLDLIQLELDRRLRERTPPQFAELWDVFKPRGWVDASVHVVRQQEGGPIGMGATVVCRDVAAMYRHFPYQLEHLSGLLTLENQRMTVDLRCLIGERPAVLAGVIDDPGPDARVQLQLQAAAVPVDPPFLKALPPDARKVVEQFHPAGSFQAQVRVSRRPMVGPDAKPEGHLVIDAELDLNPRCEITWVGLPYPIRNLTGHLSLHPDLWEFRNMRGRNGQALITGSGRVQKREGPKLPNGDPPLAIDLQLAAEDLPFNEDLRKALQPAWQKTWAIINPLGASDVEARIVVEPGRPDMNHIVITPRAESTVRLKIHRQPVPGIDQGGSFELRMENVRGRFEFDNGKVAMHDVNFLFHGAPVQFASGDVVVADSGRFALAASELWVKEIRLDSNLRTIMPHLMAQFALRLDDGRPFTARGNLQIGWSGKPGEPAWCRWDKTTVVFIDNSLKTGIPLEHLQGQLEEVRGWSNGQALEVHGIVRLGSVTLLGQQITEVESPFHIARGLAWLDDLTAKLLKGTLRGTGSISIHDTPRYSTSLRLEGALLEEYARTLPNHQAFRGTLSAAIDLSGLGTEIRSVQGKGEAHITDGDLGELPVALRFINFLNNNLSLLDSPRISGKTAFDSADVEFRVDHGTAILDPIKFTGSAFSLQGRGTRDPLGNLDLKLKVLYGRGRRLPIVSDLMREASGQFLIVRVLGTPSSSRFTLEALPQLPRLGIMRSDRDQD
jgi:hypothetical protein